MKKHLIIIATCATLALLTVRGFASAVSPTSITDSGAPFDLTSGWDFNLAQSYLVTALDFYDSGAVGGLLTSHQVGLWTSTGTLLASATIPAGTAAPLIGTYRSVAIVPIVLTPGFYEVGGFVPGNSDKYVFDAAAFTTLSGITYSASHVATGAFAFPGSQNLVSTREFTANFEVAGAPEPASAALLGLGALLLAARRRRGA